jgi:hypothetical protein
MNDLFLESLAGKIRIVYRLDPLQSRFQIEKYLDQKLKGIPPSDRLPLLERLGQYFGESPPEPHSALLSGLPGSASVDFSDVISLLLGRRVWASDLPAEELLGKSAQAFKTIFDTLNQIIGLINTTLMGKKEEFETIRQVIGSDLDAEGGHDSLQSYLDQIREAFLVAHRAFQEAAGKKVGEIFFELDPTRLESEGGGGLKFGPLRKAELYGRYKDKFAQFKSWFESGRFTEELLREFEKTCQKIYSIERGK